MKSIKFILVNETGSNEAARAISDSRGADFGQHIVVNSQGLSRGELIERLVSLRRQHPDAKILGVSEIDGERICPSEAMNSLRLELSDVEN